MTTILDLLGIDPVLLKYFPGWMVMPVALGLGGGSKQPAAKPLAPPAPPQPSSPTAATEKLLRDVSGLRSYQTTVLTRRRDHLVPGAGLPGRPPPSAAPFVPSTTPVGPNGPTAIDHSSPVPFPWPPAITPPPAAPAPGLPNVPAPTLPPTPDFRDFYTPVIPPQIPGPGSVNMPDTVFLPDQPGDNPGNPQVPGTGTPLPAAVPTGTVNMPPTIFLGPVDSAPIEKTTVPGVDTPVIAPAVPAGTVNMPDTVFLPDKPGDNPPAGHNLGGGAYLDRSPGIENNPYIMTDFSRIGAVGGTRGGTVTMPDTVFIGPVDGMRFGNGDTAPDWKHPFHTVDSFITDYSLWG